MANKRSPIFSLKKEIRRLKKEIKILRSEVDYDHMIHFVLNRRGLSSRLLPIINDMGQKAGKRKNHFYSIDEVASVFIDIDRFKKINDSLGHDIGDRVIVLLGKILRNGFRQTDLVCRWGGDEFVVIVFNSNKNYTAEKMKAVTEEFEKEAAKLAPQINPTISYGVSYWSEKHNDINSLIKVAGERMKTAKKSARKLWRIWKP